jgi:hypothetical protein
MENEPPTDIPPELQVWMDIEFKIAGRNSTTLHQQIENTMREVQGIRSLVFVDDQISIRYDPEQITAVRLRELIRQSGIQVAEEHTASSEPEADLYKGDGEGRK